jgi:hypothetical protein
MLTPARVEVKNHYRTDEEIDEFSVKRGLENRKRSQQACRATLEGHGLKNVERMLDKVCFCAKPALLF